MQQFNSNNSGNNINNNHNRVGGYQPQMHHHQHQQTITFSNNIQSQSQLLLQQQQQQQLQQHQQQRNGNNNHHQQQQTPPSTPPGPIAIRDGLSVQELKAMTARRMAHTSNNAISSELSFNNRTHDGKLNPINAAPSNNGNPASSYQTATPQQLQAAGIQPIVINDRNVAVASTTTIVRQQPLPQPSYQSNRQSTSVSIPSINNNTYHEYGIANHNNKSNNVKPSAAYGSTPQQQISAANRFSNNRSDILLASESHNIVGSRKASISSNDLNPLQEISYNNNNSNYGLIQSSTSEKLLGQQAIQQRARKDILINDYTSNDSGLSYPAPFGTRLVDSNNNRSNNILRNSVIQDSVTINNSNQRVEYLQRQFFPVVDSLNDNNIIEDMTYGGKPHNNNRNINTALYQHQNDFDNHNKYENAGAIRMIPSQQFGSKSIAIDNNNNFPHQQRGSASFSQAITTKINRYYIDRGEYESNNHHRGPEVRSPPQRVAHQQSLGDDYLRRDVDESSSAYMVNSIADSLSLLNVDTERAESRLFTQTTTMPQPKKLSKSFSQPTIPPEDFLHLVSSSSTTTSQNNFSPGGGLISSSSLLNMQSSPLSLPSLSPSSNTNTPSSQNFEPARRGELSPLVEAKTSSSRFPLLKSKTAPKLNYNSPGGNSESPMASPSLKMFGKKLLSSQAMGVPNNSKYLESNNEITESVLDALLNNNHTVATVQKPYQQDSESGRFLSNGSFYVDSNSIRDSKFDWDCEEEEEPEMKQVNNNQLDETPLQSPRYYEISQYGLLEE